ncbi:YhgE/Pip domain-containing protein [Planococcus kocurii]|uniref:YhgE/Pip domain-containing protein n=1 Tax=Planococcus kocurii TaxID=1374 RepID=UPI003CFE4F40
MKFVQFLKTKGATGAIVMGIFYAIAMLGIFLPGYSAIPANIDKLPIAIINDDNGDYGVGIADQLTENLPFKKIETNLTNQQALEELEHNKVALVVHIPEKFSENLQTGEITSTIDFTINEAGAQSVSSAMNSVVAEINNQLSTQFSQQTAQTVLMKSNVPEDQAAALAEKIEAAYAGNIVAINKVPDGMNNGMLPMFLSMACYVGAMIGAMQLVGAYRENRTKASKTRLFSYVQLTALIIAVLSTVVALGVTYLINGPSGNLFFELAGQQILNYMVCFNFAAIVIFLIGEGGMMLNLPILFFQTLSNGAIMPREMMYLPYEWMSYISPMYYSVQAYTANLYGHISTAPFIWSMVAVGGVAMLINICIIAFLHKPVELENNNADKKTNKRLNPSEVSV